MSILNSSSERMLYEVNHPAHYQGCSRLTRHILIGRFGECCKKWLDGECLDFIEDMNLNFHLGNAIKYLWRVGKKGEPVEDLQKALFYLNRLSANNFLEEKAEINKLIEELKTYD